MNGALALLIARIARRLVCTLSDAKIPEIKDTGYPVSQNSRMDLLYGAAVVAHDT